MIVFCTEIDLNRALNDSLPLSYYTDLDELYEKEGEIDCYEIEKSEVERLNAHNMMQNINLN